MSRLAKRDSGSPDAGTITGVCIGAIVGLVLLAAIATLRLHYSRRWWQGEADTSAGGRSEASKLEAGTSDVGRQIKKDEKIEAGEGKERVVEQGHGMGEAAK